MLTNEQKHPVIINVKIGAVMHSNEVNTYGNIQVLFSAIQQASGLGRDDPIPLNMKIEVKRVDDERTVELPE